jgi:hypothetical protein
MFSYSIPSHSISFIATLEPAFDVTISPSLLETNYLRHAFQDKISKEPWSTLSIPSHYSPSFLAAFLGKL